MMKKHSSVLSIIRPVVSEIRQSGKIITAATENNISLWAVLCEPLTYGLNFNKGTHSKLQIFRDLIGGFIEGTVEKNAYEIGTEIIRQSGIINDVCQDNSPENLSRKENIEELVNGMSDFCALRMEEGNLNISLTDFLSEVSLLTDQDSDNGDDEKITLMTVHSAKGLEFRNVFVVGMGRKSFSQWYGRRFSPCAGRGEAFVLCGYHSRRRTLFPFVRTYSFPLWENGIW